MRTLLWIAAAWAVMFLGIIAVDVGLTLSAGAAASSAVTQRIDFSPGVEGLIGWMERVSRRLDMLGREAFGRLYAARRAVYLQPRGAASDRRADWVKDPLGWRQWPSRHALAVLAGAGALIGGDGALVDASEASEDILCPRADASLLLPSRWPLLLRRIAGLLYFPPSG